MIMLNVTMHVNVMHIIIFTWNYHHILLYVWWPLKNEASISLVKYTLVCFQTWNTSLWPLNTSWVKTKVIKVDDVKATTIFSYENVITRFSCLMIGVNIFWMRSSKAWPTLSKSTIAKSLHIILKPMVKLNE